MQTRRAVLIAAALAPWTLACAESLLPAAADLQQLAAESARLNAPIVLLFSTPGCPYCREVRRNYLAARSADSDPATRVLLREIDITSSERLVDFEGRATTQARFASGLGVRVVPVVMAFDRRGQPVGEPLVGLDRSGFYEAYLQKLIDGARQRVSR
ncbi:MAG TPA: thioredoxin fold domain-containing protein [Burkholderiaceae bacterium]|nr:thioredoxin fold domain-containing protein [Burkholderiaceae bacterium]